jgi:hypothetical protein
VGNIDADDVGVAGADDPPVGLDERQRFQPRDLTHGIGQVVVAALAAAGHEAVRAGGDLQERAHRHDRLVLRGHALPRQHERLVRGRLDAIGAIGLDVADAVEQQRQDGDDGDDHQPRADRQRELRSSAIWSPALVCHGARSTRPPSYRS